MLEMHEGAGEIIFSSGRPIISAGLMASASVFSRGVLGQAIREGRIVEARDYDNHPAALSERKGTIKSVLAVPLRNLGNTIGALVMVSGNEPHSGLSEEQKQEIKILQSIIAAQMAVRKVERRIKRQQGLLRFANEIHDAKSVEELMSVLFKSMGKYMKYTAVTLTLLEGNMFRIFSAKGRSGHSPRAFREAISDPSSAPLTRRILAAGKPILVGDIADPTIKSFYETTSLEMDSGGATGIRSYVGAALSHGELQGVLSFQSDEAWSFGLGEMEYLGSLAQVLSYGLERVRWRALDRAVRSISRLGWTGESLKDFPRRVLTSLGELWDFDAGAVYLRQGGGVEYTLRASKGASGPPRAILLEQAFGSPCRCTSVDDLPQGMSALWNEGCSGGLLLPIPGGFIWVASRRGFTDWDLRLARLFSNELDPPFQRLNQHVRLRDEASLDPLTGVFNRRELERRLRKMIAQVKVEGGVFAIIVVDLYRFGEINNRHGHLAGDRVLARAALVLKENMREGDDVFRMGGDEFVIILRRSNRVDAKRVALRCANALARDDVLRGHGVAANFGLAEYREGDTTESLLEAADREMYAAKARRVSVLGASGEGG